MFRLDGMIPTKSSGRSLGVATRGTVLGSLVFVPHYYSGHVQRETHLSAATELNEKTKDGRRREVLLILDGSPQEDSTGNDPEHHPAIEDVPDCV